MKHPILRALMLGLCNKRIAAKLELATGTVKTHVKSILRKLDAASRTEAVAIAQRRGIPQDEHASPVRQARGARLSRSIELDQAIRRFDQPAPHGRRSEFHGRQTCVLSNGTVGGMPF
jgi:DNA-binding CsgD family transcriptional regulator